MSFTSNVSFDTKLVLHIVNTLVFIDFSLVEMTSQMSLNHKTTNVHNSQNTFKYKISFKLWIG